METERPHHHHHHHHNSTSELFICFTSMKLSSKSILSPSRNREPSQISLSSSLSRRLRSNGSINGQASPMFPTTNGKKRGCGFENPEPSSPKVTCIGQVRVKTKKQGKKMRAARSKKRRGEASFRRTEQGGFSDLQNLQQENRARWVHLPLTICEALRAFGAEFSCLFPCGREKEKGEGSGGAQSREGSCGAAFARWLVALQEGDGKGREIEIVVGEQNQLNEHGEKEDDDDRPERSRRRHVFEDIEIDVEKNEEEEEEEKGRVSICIPPKNALLLMRCRSDPVKMAALANRFWESPAHTHQEEPEDEENEQEDEEEQREVHMEEDEQVQVPEVEQDDRICEEQEISEIEANPEPEVEQAYEAEVEAEATPNAEINEENQQEKERTEEEDDDDEGGNANANANQKDETLVSISSPEVEADLEKSELVDVQQEKLEKESQDYDIQPKSSELESSGASESENNEEESVKAETFAEEPETEESAEEDEEEEEEEEKETKEKPREDETTATQERSEPDDDPKLKKPGPVLPDCLLLMMCEPKLSMEVSKETWVCSTDFIRWLPERPAKRTNGGDEPKKRISVDSKPPLPAPAAAAQPLQPPRSSCSFPAPATQMSMATMIEQKLVGSNGYEPFVLTRCKSEPMRSSAKFAQPDACFWKNRKLEPHHRPARLGVGAAGVGF